MSLGVDGGLKYWQEYILQHLSKVRKEILRSEHITRGNNERISEDRKIFLGPKGPSMREPEDQMPCSGKDLVCPSWVH